MEFDWQSAFNILAGIAGVFGSFLLYSSWEAVKELRQELKEVQMLVAGQYITRAEHAEAQKATTEVLRTIRAEQRETNDKLFAKLDEIAKEVRSPGQH